MMEPLMLKHVRQAADCLKGVIHYSPLDYSQTFSQLSGSNVYLKLENLQKTGSFKIRGAYNAIANLTKDEKKMGVITASAGNHGQGVAYASSMLGIKSTVVVPEGAPISKVSAIKDYGANVVLYGEGYDEAYQQAIALRKKSGATYIHGFDDYRVMAGQGTVALEIIEQLPGLDILIVPVGGGGLISGVASVIKELKPEVFIVGVQAKNAPSMFESIKAGKIVEISSACTIADGIAVKRPGNYTFDIIYNMVDEIVTVDDEDICRAILLLLERSKLVVEGAGAVGLAALIQCKVNFPGKNVAVIISGGNIDINTISVIIERGLIKEGRRMILNCILPDIPGSLDKLLAVLARCKGNIISIAHDRVHLGVPLKKAQVMVVLETRNNNHISEIENVLKKEGYV